MREKQQELLDRRRSCLPFVQEELSSAEHEGGQQGKNTPQQDYQMPAAHTTQEGPAGQQTAREQQRTHNREKRYALYESVKGLRRQGLSHYAIADYLGISRPTVRRFLAAEHFPGRLSASLAQRASIVAPYLPFLRERGPAGCHNGRQLFREAKARGYAGSRAQLERVTTQWRKQLPPVPAISKAATRSTPPPSPIRHRLSSKQAAFLFVRSKEKLTAQQHQQLEQMCQASEDLCAAYELSQGFVDMLNQRKVQALPEWLRRARSSGIPELKSVAKSLQQEYAAIEAACSQPWNQGQVEGQIHRLKCLKRQMDGRAQLDLLRLRLLNVA
jgi:transposase